MPFSKLSIALLQARRPGDPMAAHELACFVERTALEQHQMVPWDLVNGPMPMAEARRFDAVMLGGSGEFYVSKANLPNYDSVLDSLLAIVGAEIPVFAACFGFQLFTDALGGSIVYDPSNTEVGTFELNLTEEGRADPLVGRLPGRFLAQEGHKDRAASLPDGMANLASSARAPLQGFRVPGQSVWAVQFHPELTRRTNQDRFEHYLDSYAPHLTAEERANSLSRFHESPEASDLLRNFVELVFG